MTPNVDPKDWAGAAAVLGRLVTLPPLGQIGRQKYGPFLRAGLELFGAHGITVGFWISPHELRRYRVLAEESGREIHEDLLDPGKGSGALRDVLRRGGAELIASLPSDRFDAEFEGYPGHQSTSCLLVGLKMRDEPPAALALHRFSGPAFGESDRDLAVSLSPIFAAALDNLRRFTRAEELSITDGLTGVYNYRYLRSALDREVARAKRFREQFALIMLDVDHLKEYNDVHGHLQGSEVLRRLSQVVIGELRATDVLAKYGGDEFVIILPQTTREGAVILAERIRAAVEATAFPGEDDTIRITTSMGIAQFPEDGEVTRDLLESADRTLYEAKRTGRNRVSAMTSGSAPDGPGATGDEKK
ncbi:MAG: sensor domain-containing diguanylate cyclase [bacterium]